MNHPVLVALLLAGAVASVLACCLGLVLMRSSLARLHYLGPATLLAPLFVAAAVLAEEGLSQAGRNALLVVLLLFLQGPVMAHILGHALGLRQRPEIRNDARRGGSPPNR